MAYEKNTSADNEEKKRFTVALVGDSKYGPYAFHVEGNATNIPEFHAKTEDKKAFATFSIGISDNAWAVLGRAEGDPDLYADREPKNFIDVSAFSVTAERCSQIKKGQKVAVSGKISRATFTRTDGTPGESVRITANHCVILDEEAEPNPRISGLTSVYKGKRIPLACCALARVVSVGELQKAKSGDAYIRVSMDTLSPIDRVWALANDAYDKDQVYSVTRVRATIWRAQAIRLQPILKEGQLVCVTGAMDVYHPMDGGCYYQLNARQVSLLARSKSGQSAVNAAPNAIMSHHDHAAPAQAQAAAYSVKEQQDAFQEDGDIELPF